jgi:hypothetical protein
MYLSILNTNDTKSSRKTQKLYENYNKKNFRVILCVSYKKKKLTQKYQK